MSADRKTGENAYFILDLGCVTTITNLTVRNTHRAQYDDRGTKQLSVLTLESAHGTWVKIFTKTLPDPRNTIDAKFNFQVSGQGRYVKVRVDSHYGHSGGLQFFGVNLPAENISTPTESGSNILL